MLLKKAKLKKSSLKPGKLIPLPNSPILDTSNNFVGDIIDEVNDAVRSITAVHSGKK